MAASCIMYYDSWPNSDRKQTRNESLVTGMDRTERFYKILGLLRSHSQINIQYFLDELEVSRATFNRDLEYLRDRLNAPIQYDRHENAYRLDETSGKFELPGIWFSAGEATSLLSFLQLIEHLESGKLYDAIDPFRQQIIKHLDDDGLCVNDVLKRIRIISMNARQVEPRYFELISHVVLTQQQARILFYNRMRNETKWRLVSPQRLVHYRDNWYLDALDHKIQQLRTFSLDCINGFEIVDEPAIAMNEEQVEKELSSAYGIFSGEQIQKAVLRFTPERARWVANENWHPDQNGEFDDEGFYILSIPYSIEHELVMDILKHGSHVKVLSPESLVKTVAVMLKETLGQYKK